MNHEACWVNYTICEIAISGCYQIRKPGSAFHDSIVAPLNERIPCALKVNCQHQWWDKSAPYHMPHMSNYLFATSNCSFFNRAPCQTPVLRFCWAYGQYLVGPSVHSALCGISPLLHHSWRRNVFACKIWFKQLWCTWQWKEQATKASRKGNPRTFGVKEFQQEAIHTNKICILASWDLETLGTLVSWRGIPKCYWLVLEPRLWELFAANSALVVVKKGVFRADFHVQHGVALELCSRLKKSL